MVAQVLRRPQHQVSAPAGHHGVARRELDDAAALLVAIELCDQLPLRHIPDVDDARFAPRYHEVAVRREARLEGGSLARKVGQLTDLAA